MWSIHFYNNKSNSNVVNKNLKSISGLMSVDNLKMTYNAPNYNVTLPLPVDVIASTKNSFDIQAINYCEITHNNVKMGYFINPKTANIGGVKGEYGVFSFTCEKDVISSYWDLYKNVEVTIATNENVTNPYLKDNYVISTERDISYWLPKGVATPFDTSNLNALSFTLELVGGV